jgi:2,4-dienoyl-CoA reductase-like NADH-dependent reductase (Old Yellow Enzyme family)/thioredoxin reductase
MKFTKLFEPVRINALELKNRILMPAMVTNYGNKDNTVSDRLIAYHTARAKGGFGLNIVENFAVQPSGKAFAAVLGLWEDRFIPGCSALSEAVHASGGKIFAQIYHAGAQTTAKVIGTQPVAPTALLHPLNGTLPRALTGEEISGIVAAFGQAARRAQEAGFDGIEVHGSHGYLISEFMSTYTNRRADEYGGDLLGRLRFPREILACIRKQVGDDFPVIIRMAGDERVSDGRTIEESKIAAKILEEAGYDGFHITTATTATQHYIVPPYYVGAALNVGYAEQIKKTVTKPVITTGGIYDPFLAELILAEGRADMIGMGRASIADPELPNKIRAGAIEDIRPCVGCLQGCVGYLYYDRPITCLANPDVGREGEPAAGPPISLKKILVVGGGPAGLEAARTLAARGHSVMLYEKSSQLGGQFQIACMPPHKQRIAQLLKQMIKRTRQAGVEIHLGKTATKDSVAEIKPDLIVVATGGSPIIPDLPGLETCSVVNAWDVLAGRVAVGKKVLVIGGGSVGCETADFLASQGKHVTLVEMREDIGVDVVQRVRHFLLQRLEAGKVVVETSATVCQILGDGAVVEQCGEKRQLAGYDDLVLALGTKSENRLAAALKNDGYEVVVVGDAAEPRDALEAILTAGEIGRKY